MKERRRSVMMHTEGVIFTGEKKKNAAGVFEGEKRCLLVETREGKSRWRMGLFRERRAREREKHQRKDFEKPRISRGLPANHRSHAAGKETSARRVSVTKAKERTRRAGEHTTSRGPPQREQAH